MPYWSNIGDVTPSIISHVTGLPESTVIVREIQKIRYRGDIRNFEEYPAQCVLLPLDAHEALIKWYRRFGYGVLDVSRTRGRDGKIEPVYVPFDWSETRSSHKQMLRAYEEEQKDRILSSLLSLEKSIETS